MTWAPSAYDQAQAIADVTVVMGTVTVSGLVQHPHFRKWPLDLLIDGDEQQATNLGVKFKPAWGKLLTFDTTKCPNGQYKLRLRVICRERPGKRAFFPFLYHSTTLMTFKLEVITGFTFVSAE